MNVILDMQALHQYFPVKLINMAGHLLDAFLCMYFIHKFFEVKKAKYNNFWIVGGVILTVVLWAGDKIFKNDVRIWMLLLFSVPFFYTLIFCRENWKLKCVIYMVLYTILVALEHVGVSVTYLMAFHGIMNDTIFLVVYIFRRIILKIFLFLAIKFLLSYTIRESHYKLQKYWYMVGIICAIECFILYMLRSHKDENEKTLIFHLLLDAICCILPILMYYIVNLMENNLKRIQIETIQKNFIENQEQYIEQILKMQNSLKQFRHDYKAHLFCIDSLIQEENYEEVHRYLENLHEVVLSQENLMPYCSDNRINIILNQKREAACKKKVDFLICVKEIELKHISFYDFNILLSNLCDNAIEAAQDTEEKRIELSIKKNRAYLEIVIKNSTNGNLLRDNPSFLTSKKEKEIHGFGMQIIQNVVERYQGSLKIDGDDGWIEMSILLINEEK